MTSVPLRTALNWLKKELVPAATTASDAFRVTSTGQLWPRLIWVSHFKGMNGTLPSLRNHGLTSIKGLSSRQSSPKASMSDHAYICLDIVNPFAKISSFRIPRKTDWHKYGESLESNKSEIDNRMRNRHDRAAIDGRRSETCSPKCLAGRIFDAVSVKWTVNLFKSYL